MKIPHSSPPCVASSLASRAGKVAVDAKHQLAELGIAFVLPAGIIAALGDRAARKLHDGVDALSKHRLLRGNAGADGVGEMQSVLRQMHHAEVEGGLHQTGEIRAHLLHALRQRKERVEHDGGGLRADGGSRLGLGTFERHARVAAGVLIFECRVKAADELLKGPPPSPAGTAMTASQREQITLSNLPPCIAARRRPGN